MKIVIPDDYQNAISHLDCFGKLADHDITIYNDTVTDVDTLAERFHEANALVLIRERTAITDELLDRLPNLKLISQTGRGIPHIDVEACTRHGVVISSGGGSPNSTAELTWALVMSAMRRLPQETAALKAGKWQTTFGLGLKGHTLGIFGYGRIGSVVAGYGRAFGMNVLVWGREGSLKRASAGGFQTAISKGDLFEQSDVLCLHLKLTDETRGIVTATDLASMKPTAVLVNTCRAEVIEHGALVNALKAGRPGTAAVDVYETEPTTDDPLIALDNAICTPHIGYVEKDSYELFFTSAFDLVLAYAAGHPTNVVNPEALAIQP
ncbi:MAG: D-2-hydroxyacid dehydrogenase family protein [Chloroflexia bacterium]